MTDNNKNQELIKRYLLGEASAEEAERLEDLYFADNEAFEQLSIGEDELVSDYVQNRLAPTEREQFETVFLRTAERQDKVKIAGQLYKAAEQENIVFAAEKSNIAAPVADNAPNWWEQFLSFFRNPQMIGQLSFAAFALLVVLGGAWLVWRATRTSQEDLIASQNTPLPVASPAPTQEIIADPDITPNSNAAPQKSPTVLPKETPHNANQSASPAPTPEKQRAPVTAFLALAVGGVRSGGETKTLQIAPNITDVRLKLDFEGGDFENYSATVQTVDGRAIWRGRAVSSKTQMAHSASINLPARLLARGDYLVTLSGTEKSGAPQTIEEYYFTVRR
ncbi:MAG: hypothetical protein M3033_03585 [Acidobacteriota bacterium]|nr:hypothetical protein [Acidobacteriota bacterium]